MNLTTFFERAADAARQAQANEARRRAAAAGQPRTTGGKFQDSTPEDSHEQPETALQSPVDESPEPPAPSSTPENV